MSIEVEVIGELYTIMRGYVPQKDRQEAADNLIIFITFPLLLFLKIILVYH